MELKECKNAVLVPSGTEIIFCRSSQNENVSTVQAELNAFGLNILKRTYRTKRMFPLNAIKSNWLLFKPSNNFRALRDDQTNHKLILLEIHAVTLAFGSLISPYQFQCAGRRSVFQTDRNSTCSLYFASFNAFVTINHAKSRYKLKREHIDVVRGAIIDVKSIPDSIVIYICLRGNLDEYECRNREYGYLRRFYLQNTPGGPWQSCFSAMRLSIDSTRCPTNHIFQSFNYFIKFLHHHSISIHFGSIDLVLPCFIPAYLPFKTTHRFVREYAQHMLNSTGCRMENFANHFLRLSYENADDDKFYFMLERFRRLVLLPENYFLNVPTMLPSIDDHYDRFYLNSVCYQIDQTWTNYVRIPWFCLTPTRLIVKPYKFMRSNRVFRHISNVQQSMAFVEFRDDTGSAFFSKELVHFLQYYLENGFHFGGRHYIYLHHAQSQIRNKQFYFYCEIEGGMTREALEAWMGCFNKERVPAKNTARRTQPFSSTEATIEIEEDLVETIPDIMTPNRKYNFTDGVGQISSELMRLASVHESIGIDVDAGDYVSSVIQIRYGGCKGTLAVNPLLDGKRKQLLIRPSMRKFECEHRILELCKRSLKRRLCLNREVINLLSFRDISDACLRAYQLQNIIWLVSSLSSNQSALEVIQEKVLRVLSWSKMSSYSKFREDPFVRRLLYTTISNNLQELVSRAHIRVEGARYMFGIVDEYKVLEEGQIFIQISEEDGTKTVLTGPVAITKNPCRHPGDLRVLEAVDRRELSHHCDVLVFPQQGSRPHANEISGSDLDGDEYTVIWDSDLVPTSPNPSPYEYDSGPPPEPLDRVVTRDDRIKVILNICEQDNLGKLSNIHLVLVDQLGIDDEQSVSLAAGLSQELDSVKSGQHPYSPEDIDLINSFMGRMRPDFMQAPGYPEYPSEKILGKLFRSARSLTDVFSKAFSIESTSIILDPTLLHSDYKRYIGFATKLYKRYRKEMAEIIGSYGFSNEIDLFCCIESRNMKANERTDIQYTVKKLLKAVFQDIRTTFYEELDEFDHNNAKAAACYYVAYTDKSEKDKCMLSFPWVFANQLLQNYFSTAKVDTKNQLLEEDYFASMDILMRHLEGAILNNNEGSVDQAELVVKQLLETVAVTWSKV